MISHIRRAQLWLAALALPAVGLAIFLLRAAPYPLWTRITIGAAVVASSAWAAVRLTRHIVRPLQTVSNLLAALRENDYSIRAKGGDEGDALAAVMIESQRALRHAPDRATRSPRGHGAAAGGHRRDRRGHLRL